MGHYFKYILLTTFIGAILFIVFILFNSNRNINRLIDGNEDLLGELNIKTNLEQLQTGIVTLESKVRGTIIEGEAIDTNHLQKEIGSIRQTMEQLDTLQSDKMIAPLIDSLNRLVNAKIIFNKTLLDTFIQKGKDVAENFVSARYGSALTDSIKSVALQIDELHQLAVTEIIKEADKHSQKAKTRGTIMALIAALASIFTFGYAAYKVREQQQLIAQLNASEKKAREAAAIKENFLANMSHEIRTPLNAILGFTNLLQRKSDSTDAKEYIQSIQRSGESLRSIINDILDLSKIEAGMMRIEAAPFSIRNLLHSVESMFKAKANEKNIALMVKTDASIPATLEGDATRLTQILVNLVGNAIKFTNSGQISVTIVNEGVAGDIINTGILVGDTGIGIEKEKTGNIFERFQQAEGSVTRKYGGTGLGLSIVKDLVALQHGKIDVESEPGRGTRFHLQIPYKILNENFSDGSPGENQIAVQPGLKNTAILVVEDNEINQSLIRHLFNDWQVDFEIVNNGKQAISKLKTKQYDLVLMDIQMPEMDGYSTTQEIRNTLRLSTPVIAMTAHALPGERDKCISYGMNEYIPKPIQEDELQKLIRQFTQPKKTSADSKTIFPKDETHLYSYINLQYMKDVSGGNTAYEKTVTGQFIETIPADLKELEKSWQQKDSKKLRLIAHDMKTSISVMGLNEKLQSWLDTLEYEELDENKFQKNFLSLQSVCESAIAEARQFYSSL